MSKYSVFLTSLCIVTAVRSGVRAPHSRTHAEDASSTTLFTALSQLSFLNAGNVTADAAYSYLGLQVWYLEPENVTAPDIWQGVTPFPYLFSVNNSAHPAPPPPCTNASALMYGYDRPGGDMFGSAQPVASDNPFLCQTLCCSLPGCVAWVYASSAPGPFGSCVTGDHCCYPKNMVTAPVPTAGLVNAIVTAPPAQSNLTVPPLGIRSAVPLGGLGAGSFELRADGSMHEWTILNAYPQSTPKLTVQDDAVLSVRVAPGSGPATTRTLRTSPPAWAPDSGLDYMVYSGAYPVSKLQLNADPVLKSIGATLFASSVFKPGHAEDAAHPAAVFSLAATNPTAAPVDVSLMFQLPAAAWAECTRAQTTVLSQTSVPSYAQCLHACSGSATCNSWVHDGIANICYLMAGTGVVLYQAGAHCGVKGTWTASTEAITMQTFAGLGMDLFAGDITMRAVIEQGNGVTCTSSFGAADSPGALFNMFAASGTLNSSVSLVTAAHGAAVATCTLPPGVSATVSLVFAWYFPYRSYSGAFYNNFYGILWGSSADVAAELAEPGRLTSVIGDIATHHALFMQSSMPTWLADSLVNQYSHFRQMLWTEEGYLRMDEAMDCPDLDSVHNDYQRHLPYLWYVPTFEVQKWQQYAILNPAGYVNENPGFAPGEMGPTGRIMGDTTTIWILEMLEFYHHTGDTSMLDAYWPAIVTAAAWQIKNASVVGLPTHLICTYDILAMEVYETTTFNAFLHLAAMRAVMELASVMQDNATFNAAQQAFLRGQTATTSLLWNSTHSYFRAYTGGDAIMADCLYGQVVAWAHGLGWLMDPGMISQHLAAELKYNGNSFGLTVVTGRHTPPPEELQVQRGSLKFNVSGDQQDDAVWMGGAPDWSVLAIALGGAGPAGSNITGALEPTRKQMENWRSRLNDLWNIAGLSTTDSPDWGTDPNVLGQPLCTSHYGFAMVDYYLVYALAGQQTNIAAGKLSFAPVFPCPFALPAMLQGVEASISCSMATGQARYTFTVAFGTVSLPAKGLSVNGVAYPSAFSLGEGESVSWP